MLKLTSFGTAVARSVPGTCEATLFTFSKNISHSALALNLFDELPERDEALVSKKKLPCDISSKKRLPSYPARENLLIKDSLKRGNAQQALGSFYQLIADGEKPTESVYCVTLSACSRTSNRLLGFQIHARIIRCGYEGNVYLGSALVGFYAKHNAVGDAGKVFHNLKNHDQVSWTSFLSALAQNGHSREALLLFRDMLSSSVEPNCFTYVSAISACTGLEAMLQQAALLHSHVIIRGFQSNSYIGSSLIDCYSKCGRLVRAVSVFRAASARDNIIFNSMIAAYSSNKCGEDALALFAEMRKDGVDPCTYTLNSILNACGSLTIVLQGRQVHSLVIKMGSGSSVFVASALVDMYSKCGSVSEARHVFDQIPEKNSVLWTSLMTGYAQNGRGVDALRLFERFVGEEGIVPDHMCFTAVLTACNHAGLFEEGVRYFNLMRNKYGLDPHIDQYACLIDLHTRNGHLRKAKALMEEMPYDPNPVMLSSFLSSCRVYGEVELGKEVADKLFIMESSNGAPYATMASMYAEVGLWGNVAEIWRSMREKGVKKTAGWSWVEIDNRVSVFSAGDACHPYLPEIYAELRKLKMEMEARPTMTGEDWQEILIEI